MPNTVFSLSSAELARLDAAGLRVPGLRHAGRLAAGSRIETPTSIIAVVATDAPLLPHQLERIAQRVAMGVARVGGTAGNGSGDIFVAFSTANADAASASAGVAKIEVLANDELDGLFEATVQATEEAIVNAMVAARTMSGFEGHELRAIDHDALRRILRRHRLLREP